MIHLFLPLLSDRLELSTKTFNFACYARLRFQIGTLHEKKEILSTIGSNLVLKDKILSLSVPKPFVALKEAKVETDRIVASFKPVEKIDMTAQMMYFYQESLTLRRVQDLNLRFFYKKRVFETRAINHSANPPKNFQYVRLGRFELPTARSAI